MVVSTAFRRVAMYRPRIVLGQGLALSRDLSRCNITAVSTSAFRARGFSDEAGEGEEEEEPEPQGKAPLATFYGYTGACLSIFKSIRFLT